MRLGLRAGAALLLLLAAALLPGSAGACACGEFSGPVIAHGSSPAGAPWKVRAIGVEPARGPDRAALFGFSYGPGTGDGTGGFTSLPLAIRRQPFLTATRGGEVGPYAEYDVSGIVQARATEIVVRFSAGEPLRAEPQLPAAGLRKRLPWIQGFRFFDIFFPGEAEPTRIEALDRDGRVLATQPL